jgi:hypothetical protein
MSGVDRRGVMPIDADHLRAEIGEHHPCEGRGTDRGELQHPHG